MSSYKSIMTTSDTIEFAKADTITLGYEFWIDDETPIDLTVPGITPIWTLVPYGYHEFNVLTKPMLVSTTEPHVATVNLTYSDTIGLIESFIYTEQTIIRYEKNGEIKEYRRSERDIILHPRNEYDENVLFKTI